MAITVWIAILLPPLLVPDTLERPDRCPACNSQGTLRVHERVRSRIPYIAALVDARQGRPSESHVRAVRFSCRACKRTFTSRRPERQPGSLASSYVSAYVVTWYCLGLRPSAIYEKLADYDLEMSRASIYRLIARATDPTIRKLHRVRRRRFQLLTVYSMDRHRPELCDGARLPIFSVEESAASQAMVRSTALVCRIYGDADSRLTVQWLDGFLRQFKFAGVLIYPDRSTLEKSLGSTEDLSRRVPAASSLLHENERNGSLLTIEPTVRTILAAAVRLSQIAPESERPLPLAEDVFDRV